MVNNDPFPTGLYSVEGRLFRTRDEAVSYCKAERIPVWKVGLAPPLPGVDLDPIKLSLRESWTLRVLFDDGEPVIVFSHAAEAHAFSVRMSDVADLVSAFKARVRELAKRGEP